MNAFRTVIQTCVHKIKQETLREREIACLCFLALEELLFRCVDECPEWIYTLDNVDWIYV